VLLINMQKKDHYGTVYIVPFTPNDGSDPIQVLKDVVEIKEWYTYKDKDGKEAKGQKWIKLLDSKAYKNLRRTDESSADDLARIAEDVTKYSGIKSKIKTLLNHRYHSNKDKSNEIKNERIRIKSYTVICGFILRYTPLGKALPYDGKPAILIFSSVKFDQALVTAFNSKTDLAGPAWIANLANNSLVERKQFLSIQYRLLDASEGIGYKAAVTIEPFNEDTAKLTDGKERLDLTSKKELLDKLYDPAKIFLEIPADKELFDEKYIESFENRVDKWIERIAPGTTQASTPAAPSTDGSGAETVDPSKVANSGPKDANPDANSDDDAEDKPF
jgi:hypothetical protein